MIKNLKISAITAALLLGLGAISVQAGEGALKDSVAQKEAKALEQNGVKGESSAKAKVEETNAKVEFESKLDVQKFAQEARIDRAKRLQRIFSKEASFHKDTLKNTPKEVMEAINLTTKAVRAIQANKIDEAVKYLDKASEDFAKALKANPNLGLVPVAQSVQIKTFAGDSKIIAKALVVTDELIQKHATQDARDVLIPLQDEMDFMVQLLPMKTYPLVAKKASELLKKKKVQDALMVLSEGFGTIVGVAQVIPIPLMLAQDMVIEASKLAKDKKDEAIKLLDSAKEELKRAELLGYTQRHSVAYKALTTQINSIEKEIKGKNEPAKLYDELKKKFEALFEKVRLDNKK